MIDILELPSKLEPVAVITFDWLNEEKELNCRLETGKILYDKW